MGLGVRPLVAFLSSIVKNDKPVGWQLVTTDLLSNNINYNMSAVNFRSSFHCSNFGLQVFDILGAFF